MQKPPIPSNEEERLKALRALNILDTPPEEQFDRISRLAKHIFQVPVALIGFIDADRQWLKCNDGFGEIHEIPRDVSFCAHTINGQQPVIVEDATKDPRFADSPGVTGEPGVRFYAGFPLYFRDQFALGTLCLIDFKPRTLSNDDLLILKDLAAIVEGEFTALELATVDPLTSLANRRGFETLANHSLKLSHRTDIPTCVVYIDLDRFKEINDQFGHHEGDIALVDFAELLRRSFRDVDIIARLAGDEFAVFLTDSDFDETQLAVERLERSVSEYNSAPNKGYTLSFSAGIAAYDSLQHMFVSDLMAEADRAMYQQKKSKLTNNLTP